MRKLSKDEFVYKVINDLEKKESKKRNDFQGYISDSVQRCKRLSGKKHIKLGGQR